MAKPVLRCHGEPDDWLMPAIVGFEHLVRQCHASADLPKASHGTSIKLEVFLEPENASEGDAAQVVDVVAEPVGARVVERKLQGSSTLGLRAVTDNEIVLDLVARRSFLSVPCRLPFRSALSKQLRGYKYGKHVYNAFLLFVIFLWCILTTLSPGERVVEHPTQSEVHALHLDEVTIWMRTLMWLIIWRMTFEQYMPAIGRLTGFTFEAVVLVICGSIWTVALKAERFAVLSAAGELPTTYMIADIVNGIFTMPIAMFVVGNMDAFVLPRYAKSIVLGFVGVVSVFLYLRGRFLQQWLDDEDCWWTYCGTRQQIFLSTSWNMTFFIFKLFYMYLFDDYAVLRTEYTMYPTNRLCCKPKARKKKEYEQDSHGERDAPAVSLARRVRDDVEAKDGMRPTMLSIAPGALQTKGVLIDVHQYSVQQSTVVLGSSVTPTSVSSTLSSPPTSANQDPPELQTCTPLSRISSSLDFTERGALKLLDLTESSSSKLTERWSLDLSQYAGFGPPPDANQAGNDVNWVGNA